MRVIGNVKGWMCIGAMGLAGQTAMAAVTLSVSFNDPGNLYGSYYSGLQSSVLAAGNDWLGRFAVTSANTTLTISIGFAAIPTANGGSGTSSFVGTTAGGQTLYEQGAAHKIKTGIDDNGAAADIVFNVGINGYLQNELWFDPDPVAQTALVPSNRTDARSVFLHEFGHAFVFNGWRDSTTGALPGNYLSTFDAASELRSTAAGPTLFFTGPAATAVYGGAVPLTYGNYGHLGNNSPRPGSDLIPDLMNGIVYFRGTRYQISALDLAIARDAGLPLISAVPEPAAWLLMAGGLAVVGAQRRLRATTTPTS